MAEEMKKISLGTGIILSGISFGFVMNIEKINKKSRYLIRWEDGYFNWYSKGHVEEYFEVL